MKDIRILESLQEKLETKFEDIDIYDYEKHTNISKFVKQFKQNNPNLIVKYLQEENLFEEEITLNDIICIMDNQIKSLKEAVKKDTVSEYERFLKQQ